MTDWASVCILHCCCHPRAVSPSFLGTTLLSRGRGAAQVPLRASGGLGAAKDGKRKWPLSPNQRVSPPPGTVSPSANRSSGLLTKLWVKELINAPDPESQHSVSRREETQAALLPHAPSLPPLSRSGWSSVPRFSAPPAAEPFAGTSSKLLRPGLRSLDSGASSPAPFLASSLRTENQRHPSRVPPSLSLSLQTLFWGGALPLRRHPEGLSRSARLAVSPSPGYNFRAKLPPG